MNNGGFGVSVSSANGVSLIGAYGEATYRGYAYIFRNLSTVTGVVTQSARLSVSDGVTDDTFGYSVSLDAGNALIGAYGLGSYRGAAYVFRNASTATGTVAESVKLSASDGQPDDNFGDKVSLSGTIGLVGAPYDTIGANVSQGSAYVFRNLGTATGTITQAAKLQASDGADGDRFANAVAISGTVGLVGAANADVAKTQQGSVYVFKNLDSAGGTVTQNAKLLASDPTSGGQFGWSLSISGTSALVGARGQNNLEGAAYLYRNFASAAGTVVEDVQLRSRTGPVRFGESVSLSGNSALVSDNSDHAFLFTNLDTANGLTYETLRLFPNPGGNVSPYGGGSFGSSVSLDGEIFTIGAVYAEGLVAKSGRAFTGLVSTYTTLDVGNTSRVLDYVSFDGATEWVVGRNTSANQVTVASDSSAGARAIFIGKNAGSNNNKIIVQGQISASLVDIGADGNTGNTLTGKGIVASDVFVHRGNIIAPGDRVGSLQTGGETWEGGGIYQWDLRDATAAAGTGYDQLAIGGTLLLTATTTDRFTLRILGLTAGDVLGTPANFSPLINQQWIIATTSGITGFTPGSIQIDQSANAAVWGAGTFAVTQSGNDLVLNFQVVPEPGSALLTACGLITLALRRRSRTA